MVKNLASETCYWFASPKHISDAVCMHVQMAIDQFKQFPIIAFLQRDILVEPIKKLFVAGFRDSNITEDDFREYFSSYCNVEKIHLVTDKESGRSKGFGFVELSNHHMVDKAASESNPSTHQRRLINLRLKKSPVSGHWSASKSVQ